MSTQLLVGHFTWHKWEEPTIHSSVYPASPDAKWQSSGTGQGTGIFDGSEATIARQWQAMLLEPAVSVLGHSNRYAASARASAAASTHQKFSNPGALQRLSALQQWPSTLFHVALYNCAWTQGSIDAS